MGTPAELSDQDRAIALADARAIIAGVEDDTMDPNERLQELASKRAVERWEQRNPLARVPAGQAIELDMTVLRMAQLLVELDRDYKAGLEQLKIGLDQCAICGAPVASNACTRCQ